MNLIEEAKNRDPDAFDQLMQGQLKRMYRVAYSMLENDQDAADAIQETVLKCWEKIGQLKQEEYFQTWLTRILINECRDMLKCRKRVVYMEELPEVEYTEDYASREWKEMLAGLGEKYRVVMELHYLQGFAANEIAAMLGISPVNVRSRLARGRKQLKQYLETESQAGKA